MKLEILKNMKLIKSPDSEIREGAYSQLIELFSKTDNLPTLEEKNQYLDELCSANYLFYGIEAGVSDCTVARSFSLLVLGLIVENDKTNEIEIDKIIFPLIKYIKLESDFRGKDNKLGWIHSLAHLGDLIAFISCHKGASVKSLELICLAIIEKIISLNELQLLNHGEDNRLALGIYYALEEKLVCHEQVFNLLISGLKLDYPRKQNIENIVRCLYVELINNSRNKVLVDQAKLLLKHP
jgi:hypothetical protein